MIMHREHAPTTALGITMKEVVPRNATTRAIAERKAAALAPERCGALVPMMRRTVEGNGRVTYPYVTDADGDVLYRVCDNPTGRCCRRCGDHRGMVKG